MRIDIVTVFPEMIREALGHSIIKRAMDRGIVTIHVVNLRDYTRDRHKTTDDMPYGGGGGMVMKIEPIARALVALTSEQSGETTALPGPSTDTDVSEPTEPEIAELGEKCRLARPRIVLTDPRGKTFTQETARQWAGEDHLILLCGHYEGVDDRVRQHLVTEEASIGDYILTGGELPALVIVDAITRLQTGALGDEAAPEKDSFSENLLEYPHYTRPYNYLGWRAPDILLSGHHARIELWRRWHQLRETRARRPDLFQQLNLSTQDAKLLSSAEPSVPLDDKKARSRFVEETSVKPEDHLL